MIVIVDYNAGNLTSVQLALRSVGVEATISRDPIERFVEHGFESAVYRKPATDRLYRKLDGAGEARLIATACSAPPQGRIRWTLQMLADELIALEVVESISHECVRTTLKKTNSSLI
jgi:hypothetical protein